MTYFQCSVTGKGNTVIVTCDSEFAGTTVTFTNGTKTYIRTCPSSSPYEIEFHGIEAGTWTVSAVEGGTTYSYTFLVKDEVALLAHGFNWRTWVSEGGLDPDDYDDLDDVFDDEPAVRRLMLIHDSADYLITCVTEKLNDIDAFCANDTAMKWIGLCDYVCDGLEAIDGVVAKFLASTYWERYLKDHVPVMTSNSAPYGTVICDSTDSTQFAAWHAFDGVHSSDNSRWLSGGGAFPHYVGYCFNNPVCVKYVSFEAPRGGTSANYTRIKDYDVEGSNDGTNWVTIYSDTAVNTPYIEQHAIFENDSYYRYYRLKIKNKYDPEGGTWGSVLELQFYGRAMSVSVPKMTSNTAPYGEVSANSYQSSYEPYKAFNGATSPFYASVLPDENAWVAYDFKKPVRIKSCMVVAGTPSSEYMFNYKIQKYVDDAWVDMTEPTTDKPYRKWFDTSDDTHISSKFRVKATEYSRYHYMQVAIIQFYGVDYSEKEFESGTNAVWLHDHGLDLATLTTAGTAVIGNEQITLSAVNDQASKVVDLSNYSLIRVRVGDRMSGTTQIIASTTAVATLNANDAPNANGLNISAVNQELDTGVKMTSTGTCDILELWLE